MSEIKQLIHKLADRYGRNRESLLPIMQDYLEQETFLTEEALTAVATELDISAAQVYGTTTFYSFLDTQPRGEFIIRLCQTITCDMKGKRQILNTIENLLKIKVGETTRDNKFTLLLTNCLGQCHKGPAMLINDRVYTELTTEKTTEIINTYLQK
jgi:NADH:ubiquinone oxidoreductase subunit E